MRTTRRAKRKSVESKRKMVALEKERKMASLELAKTYPRYDLIRPDSEICSILRNYRNEYRSSHPPLGSSKDLKNVHPQQHGGRHIGMYAFRTHKDDKLLDFSTPFGTLITTDAAEYVDIHSTLNTALFILLLEDEKILIRLVAQLFHMRFPCIMISTVPGRPTDLATRLFLKKVHIHLKLPVLAFGSLSCSWLDHLQVYRTGLPTDGADLGITDIKLLGLTPLDVQTYTDHIPAEFRGKMQPQDLNRIASMIKDKPWLSAMFGCNLPQQVEAANPHGMTDFCLMSAYLPLKLQEKHWFGPWSFTQLIPFDQCLLDFGYSSKM